jgi:hypothetical protein
MNAIKKQERIEYLEREMKRMFQSDAINDIVVYEYNILEKEWKLLTKYKERTRNPLKFKIPKFRNQILNKA